MSETSDRAKVAQQLTAYHALHSYFVDALVEMGERSREQAAIADRIADKVGGLAFESFATAVAEQKLLRVSESMLPSNNTEGAVRLEVRGDDGQWHGLLRVLPDRLGLPVVPFEAMTGDVDAALQELLDDAPRPDDEGGGSVD